MDMESFGRLAMRANREELRGKIPPYSRMVTSRNHPTPELRLGALYSPSVRYVYGYIGLIERLRGSNNTGASFFMSRNYEIDLD